MLLIVSIVLLALWFFGFLANVGGLINLLLVIALVTFIAHLLVGRRAV